nr:glycosyltransferase family 4 protein [Marinobacter xestospongiae]
MAHPHVLHITRNLPPLVGGMERLNWHMAEELAKYATVTVIGPAGAAQYKPESVDISEVPLKPLPLFLTLAFARGLWLAFRERPEVILAGSGLTAPIAWLLSKLCGARSAVYLHGFDITASNTVYRKLWRPTFKLLDHVIVNSTPTKELAVAAGVSKNNLSLVHPGADLPESPQSAERIASFREKHGLQNKKILLSVGRLTTRKGLREFVEHALPQIVDQEPDSVLVVIGEAPKDALGAGIQSVESIQEQARKSNVGEHLKFLGVITDRTLLATAYEAAHVHVFPVRHIPEDPEGFGMVAIEAAAHGLPTVAFKTGGVIDAVSHGESGYLVKTENYTDLSKNTISAIRKPIERSSIVRFSMKFSWNQFGKSISKALISSMKNPKKKKSTKN